MTTGDVASLHAGRMTPRAPGARDGSWTSSHWLLATVALNHCARASNRRAVSVHDADGRSLSLVA
eukprot:36404-Prymnesium_polylepis.1